MKKYLLPLFSFFCFAANGQTEAFIKKHYQEVNKQIEDSKQQGYEGPLYCNELVVNKNGKSWPAVGLFNETVSFWYNDDPNHLPASERNPKNVLLKVMLSSRRSSDAQTNEEYLFSGGVLLFYFYYWAEESNVWETRAWFNAKGVMFKSQVKKNDTILTEKQLNEEDNKDLRPSAKSILSLAKKLQDQFLLSM